MRRPIACFSLLFVCAIVSLPATAQSVTTQPLRELYVQPSSGPPYIDRAHRRGAYLVFQSSIPNLTFRSNWIIYRNMSEPENGRYILNVDTVHQSLRIFVPGAYRMTEIAIARLEARETRHFIVEPIDQRLFEQALDSYGAGHYDKARQELNAYLALEYLLSEHRDHATYLLAMSLVELGETRAAEREVRKLCERTPEYEPFTNAAPLEVVQYAMAVKDSLHALPPQAPQDVRARFTGNRVVLSWRSNTTDTDLQGYHVYRGLEPSRLERIASVRTASFTDEFVTPASTYYYAIKAYDDYTPPNESAYSALRQVTITPDVSKMIAVDPALPPAVQNLVLYPVSDSLLGLSYDLIGGFHRTYDIELSISTDTYAVVPKSLAGDYGANVPDGLNKRITWNVLKDISFGAGDRQFTLHMEASPQPLADQVVVDADPDTLIQALTATAENDSLVVFSYTLSGDRKKTYWIDLEVSDDRGLRFNLAHDSFEGDWGARQVPGSGKRIAWHVLQFFPDGLVGEIHVQFIATEEPPRKRRAWKFIAGGSAALGVLALVFNPFKSTPAPVSDDPPPRPDL